MWRRRQRRCANNMSWLFSVKVRCCVEHAGVAEAERVYLLHAGHQGGAPWHPDRICKVMSPFVFFQTLCAAADG